MLLGPSGHEGGRKIDTKKSDEKFEPQIAFSGSMVNSDDRMISDLLLTNIRA